MPVPPPSPDVPENCTSATATSGRHSEEEPYLMDSFHGPCRSTPEPANDDLWSGAPALGGNGRAARLIGAKQDRSGQGRASAGPARRASEVPLEESRDLMQSVIDSVTDLIFVKDADGRFIVTNRALDESCGVLRGSTTGEAFDEDLAHRYDIADREVLDTGLSKTFDEVIPVRGEPRLFRTAKVPWMRQGVPSGIIGVSRDVTDQERSAQALRRSELVNRSIVEASADCIILLDLDGNVAFKNGRALEALRGAEAAHPGSPWPDHFPLDTVPQAKAAFAAARRGETARFTFKHVAADGTDRWADSVLTPVHADSGEVVHVLVISRDITQQKTNEEQVRWFANHDPLTRLPNRWLFQETLDSLIAGAGDQPFALLLLDLDDFKGLNDCLGHDGGDALLCWFGERLRSASGTHDLVSRLGGDEFAIILPMARTCDDVYAAMEHILEGLREPFVYAGRVLDCHASIGASLYPDMGASRLELIKNADIALYAAKDSGRSATRLFEPVMRAEAQTRSSMLALAREAVRADLITPYYQPKVELRTARLSGFEALLRWHHPDRGVQTPDTVAAAFDDPGLAAEISDRMIALVIQDVRRWLDDGVDFGHVAVNAAAAEFRRGCFAERLLDQLAGAGIPTRYIQLEVTETVFLGRGAECVGNALKILSEAGVMIALDDFGTGYASLAHLKQFPVDILKIDRSFVRNLHGDADDEAIVRAVIGLGKSLNIGIVAEGIETPAQSAFLRKYDCDYGQGFLFSQAQASAHVAALVESFAARASRIERRSGSRPASSGDGVPDGGGNPGPGSRSSR